ncbi:hypothetical protein [Curtobacterium sp. MCSS17_005]|uniref:hypothetical protein n=1 Tax=Curtobacterium sp. MCSS17_005 TaxID=2175641 RepID=UPI0015E886C6|nr:hypothetical protein [Curtobacterium sp. MCSS17_005]MDO3697089.1 hypothetical protein [Curtobacterium flaccumfaciens]MDO3699241.1 hypothetical protein [Curtobacterium flaccumfaciens]WIB33880.1 hypothetical protein DEJ20_05275 [Curtobacterium sp. MCSS17_005]
MTTHTTTTPSRLRRLALPFVGAIALTVALIAPVSPASAAGAVPKGDPYLLYTASISANGTGTGYSSYINVHDAHNNAYAFGIQSDKGSPQSKGKPRYIWERVQNGKFTYGYLGPATNKLTPIGMRWYKNDVATMIVNHKTIGTLKLNLDGRLFFNAEANARLNGDVVHSTVQNTRITVGDRKSNTGLNGKWDTSFSFHGLKAKQTNSPRVQGASFKIDGRVTGLPRGGNWDTAQVSGIGMIAQKW